VLNRLTRYNFGEHQSQIDVVISMIQNSNGKNNIDFVDHIKKIDLIRNQDLRLAHKEIANAMGYMLN